MPSGAVVGRAGPVFGNALSETVSREYPGVLEGIVVQVAFRKSRSNKALQLTAHRRFQLSVPSALKWRLGGTLPFRVGGS